MGETTVELFHVHKQRRIPGIRCNDSVANNETVQSTGLHPTSGIVQPRESFGHVRRYSLVRDSPNWRGIQKTRFEDVRFSQWVALAREAEKDKPFTAFISG